MALWLELTLVIKLSIECGSLNPVAGVRVGVVSVLVLWWLENINLFDGLGIWVCEIISLPL